MRNYHLIKLGDRVDFEHRGEQLSGVVVKADKPTILRSDWGYVTVQVTRTGASEELVGIGLYTNGRLIPCAPAAAPAIVEAARNRMERSLRKYPVWAARFDAGERFGY